MLYDENWANFKSIFFAEVEAIFGGKSVEMDLSVDEYLQGEKHQLGRHVTMLLILLLTITVVSKSNPVVIKPEVFSTTVCTFIS